MDGKAKTPAAKKGKKEKPPAAKRGKAAGAGPAAAKREKADAGPAAAKREKAGPAAAKREKAGPAPAAAAAKREKAGPAPRERLQRAIYFDANSTTHVPEAVIETTVLWMNRGNPSAAHASAREAREMMDDFRALIAEVGGFRIPPEGAARGAPGYRVIFTSGASESNCHVITAAVRAYAARTGETPHVITSAAEHHSLLACCRRLVQDKMATATYLPVAAGGGGVGTVPVRGLEDALREHPATCIVSVMAANNESGAINDVKALAAAAHAQKVPFHSDAVQVFGRSALSPEKLGLDAYSASFHKLGGPLGVGLLVINNQFLEGYGLPAHICGTQNGGLRGGTENVPGIAGAFAAYRLAMSGRREKNAAVRRTRDRIWAGLKRHYRCVALAEYLAARPALERARAAPAGGSPVDPRAPAEEGARLALEIGAAERAGNPVLVWLASADTAARVLPNTLFLAVLYPGFCNVRARADLEKRGVIISIGSACNTAAAEASHVVSAMRIPPELRAGVLRVSLPDGATAADADRFVAAFAGVVR